MVNLAKKVLSVALFSLTALFFSCIQCGWAQDCSNPTLPDGGDGGTYSSGLSGRCNSSSEVATRGQACNQARARDAGSGALRCNGQPITSQSQQLQVVFKNDDTSCYDWKTFYIADSQLEALGCGEVEADGCNLTASTAQLSSYNCARNGGSSSSVESASNAEATACVKYSFPNDSVSCSSL